MMLPLLSPTNSFPDDKFLYIECSAEISHDDEGERTPRLSSPKNTSSFKPFKNLVDILDDKVNLLTNNIDHLREEIEEKNATINRLLDFINKMIYVREVNDTDTEEYNNSVAEYNHKINEQNFYKQQNNITSRRKKRPRSDSHKEGGVDALDDDSVPLIRPSIVTPVIPAYTPPVHTVLLQDEIKFLKDELSNKNKVIEFLMCRNSTDTRYRVIIDEDNEEGDDDLDEEPVLLASHMPESIHDSTLEVMERLFVEHLTSVESTLQTDNTLDSNESLNGIFREFDEDDNVSGTPHVNFNEILNDLDQTRPPDEEEEPEEREKSDDLKESIEDLFNQRINKLEQMITNMHQKAEMLSVAPWDKHSNGFATQYMTKNGHEPGKGLGKTGNGITEPISVKKNTLDSSINVSTWQRGTILIAGDSMIGGLEEKKMSRTGKVKVRSHGGATIKDMRDHLSAHLRKKPDRLIIHAHANDASIKEITADDMFDRLMDLKAFAEEKVPDIKVTFSCPITRTDSGIANAKQMHLNNRLKRSGLAIVLNDNIDEEDLGRKGLHLKPSGSSKLAKNIIDYFKSV